MSVEQSLETGRLEARNIGGIDETEVTFEPGVTVLAGRNATNRTSLLQAIMAAHGSDDVSIKADAEEAEVELSLGEETYTRTLTRQNGTVTSTGDPYLEESTIADLFAFLVESNEARRAVVTDADLRDIIMRPVDTDDIQANIDRLVDERQTISDQLEELDDLKGQLPSLEEERQRLNNEIEETREELEELEAEIDERDADVDQSREEQAELEETLETLREKRSNLEDVRYELDTEEESLESLREEKQEVENEFDDLHIVRQSAGGTTYEDTIDHLSESEREVTGLIFALAGYLAHEVYETVPFMLLDSLEAIDADRIATLIEYFGDYSEYLVVALLPEDASNVDADNQIESI